MFSFLVFSIVLLNGVLALFYSGNILSGLLNFSSWEETAYCLVMAAEIKGVRVILNELSSYLLIKRGWFNGEKTTSF
jgi:hypothetical protein